MKIIKLFAFGVLPLLGLSVVLYLNDHRAETHYDEGAFDQQADSRQPTRLPEPSISKISQKSAATNSIDFQKRREELQERRKERIAKLAVLADQRPQEGRQQLLDGLISYREQKLKPLFDSWDLDETKRATVMTIISEWEEYNMNKWDSQIKRMNSKEYHLSSDAGRKIRGDFKTDDLTELALAETRLMDLLGNERFKELNRVWRRPITAD